MQIDFDQYVEYKTTEGIFSVPPDAHTLDSVPTLEAVRDGYTNAIALGRTPQLSVETFKQAAADVYHEDVLEAEVSADPVQTFDRLAWVRSRPEWRPNVDVEAGDVLFFEGNLYEVIEGKSHRTQADWTPPKARSLFKRYYNPDAVEEWVQPLADFDSYREGARAILDGYYWTSLIDNNVWRPGAPGTEALWQRGGVVLPDGSEGEPEPVTEEWKVGVAYKGDNTLGAGNGDVRTYQGSTYRCLQSHTSQVGWQPPNAPALWLKL